MATAIPFTDDESNGVLLDTLEKAQQKLLSGYGSWKFSKNLNIFDGCHAVLLLTEWSEYKNINWYEVAKKMVRPGWVFDSRSIIDPISIKNANLNFWRVGDGSDEENINF